MKLTEPAIISVAALKGNAHWERFAEELQRLEVECMYEAAARRGEDAIRALGAAEKLTELNGKIAKAPEVARDIQKKQSNHR